MSESKLCPYCAEEVRSEAVKCKHCGSYLGGRRGGIGKDWYRSDRDRMLGGVCGGLAELFGLPTAVLRLAFVLGAFISGGAAIVIYLVLWIVMPLEEGDRDRYRDLDDEPYSTRDLRDDP